MISLKGSEVLVAGAGPVGLTAALSLARRGIQVSIVEEESGPGARSYALVLHSGSLEILDSLGVLADLLEFGHPLHTLAFFDGPVRSDELSFYNLKTQYPLVLVLPQNDLERILIRHLRALGVRIFWNHRLGAVEDNGHSVTVAVHELDVDSRGYATYVTDWVIENTLRDEVQFVIGADGHRSTVCRALGIDFPEVAPAALYAIVEMSTSEPVFDESRIVFGDSHTDVLWPLSNERLRWSLQLPDHHWGEESRLKQRSALFFGGVGFPYLSMLETRELLQDRAPWFRTEHCDMDWGITVRFERRLAERFGSGRVWLAGDSAHLTGPIGVQSMNVGIREADDLADRINDVLLHGNDDLRALDHYNTERLHEWHRLFGMERPPVAGPAAAAWTHGREARILSALPASGELLSQMLHQIGIEEPVVLA